jgi:hypothetical protein
LENFAIQELTNHEDTKDTKEEEEEGRRGGVRKIG